jgi:hypothetical protein
MKGRQTAVKAVRDKVYEVAGRISSKGETRAKIF